MTRLYRLDNKEEIIGIHMTLVVIADPIHSDAVSLLKETGFEVADLSSNKEELNSYLPKAEVLIVRSATKVRGDFLSSCTNLKMVGRSGVGLDNIDLDECKRRNINVVNSPEGPTRSVAELALGLMIASVRKFGIVLPRTKAGEWPKKTKGHELFDKTLGIIGSGAIGAQLAKYAIALGMKVLAYDIIEYDDLKALDSFSYVSFDELIANSDIISTHVPLLPATKHMINKDALSKMKDGVILIHTSRGGVIDESILLEGLENGKIGGVALDVYESEPVDTSQALFQHPLVITTPHIGAQTTEASRNNSMVIAQKIIKYFES